MQSGFFMFSVDVVFTCTSCVDSSATSATSATASAGAGSASACCEPSASSLVVAAVT